MQGWRRNVIKIAAVTFHVRGYSTFGGSFQVGQSVFSGNASSAGLHYEIRIDPAIWGNGSPGSLGDGHSELDLAAADGDGKVIEIFADIRADVRKWDYFVRKWAKSLFFEYKWQNKCLSNSYDKWKYFFRIMRGTIFVKQVLK